MKRIRCAAVLLALALLTGCAAEAAPAAPSAAPERAGVVDIALSDDGVVCASDAVYTANDIIYYESGRGADYGKGGADDAHDPQEAAAHTVVHITAPGVYRVTGTLSAGQLFVDLGEDAVTDPAACVTLLLDGAQLSCAVAPAVLFYRVYECAPGEAFTLTPELSGAGAVVELADGSFNLVNGAYVAPIYQEGTQELLHRFDGAFYSRMSMRVEGDTGSLTINGAKEGLDTERHLELNGGNLSVAAQDDGINTNADGLSVTTVNGGMLTVSGGSGGDGDGIDSNGAVVINGGTVFASAGMEGEAGGLDADAGIYLNGGVVVATGACNDGAANESKQQFMELQFAETVAPGSSLCIFDGDTVLLEDTVTRPFQSLTLSAPELEAGVDYAVTVNGVAQQYDAADRFRTEFDAPPTEDRGPGEFEIPEPPGGMDQPVISVEGGAQTGVQPEVADGMQLLPTEPDAEAAVLATSQAFTLTQTEHTFRNVRDAL